MVPAKCESGHNLLQQVGTFASSGHENFKQSDGGFAHPFRVCEPCMVEPCVIHDVGDFEHHSPARALSSLTCSRKWEKSVVTLPFMPVSTVFSRSAGFETALLSVSPTRLN